MPLTIVIPTYGRDEILVQTLEHLLELDPAAAEILVVDQTREHQEPARERLEQLERQRAIRWLHLEPPSITRAMNVGLLQAQNERVLFLDDDIVPAPELVAAHGRVGGQGGGRVVVAGQVLQPGEVPSELRDGAFAFRSSIPQPIGELMGGNFSVSRQLAREIGGFDENFLGAAYRFEADFSRRVLGAGASIQFEPTASIRHLRAERGGTRRYGSHLRTPRPYHSVGEYYYLFRHRPAGWLRAALGRPWRAVLTRHHLRRPWWIPATMLAEISGCFMAFRLSSSPPRLLPRGVETESLGGSEGVHS